MPASEPFFFRGGDVGCLLIHGFSGNPVDMRPLADRLAADGFTVDLPLLPGHGPTPEGQGRARWRDWVAAVAAAHDALSEICRHVVIVGFSMGGALAMIETNRRAPVALVLIAVPTFVDRDWRVGLLPVAKYVVRWWYPFAQADFDDPVVRAGVLKRSPEVDIDDPRVQEQLRKAIRIPTAAIDHFFRLTRRARKQIKMVTAPTLIVQGRQDSTALPVCAEEIYRELGSARKEIAWFDESGHMLINGPESGAVIERIVGWIDAQVGQSDPVPMG